MSAERRLGLDVLKGAAILLVVFNHALLWPMRAGDRPSAFLYGIAFGTVAAFSAVAGYVQGLHPPREEWALLKKRAGQLLVPWAIWAPIYAALPFVWRAVGGGTLPFTIEPWPWVREILLGGGPLWFLTVLFAATAVCAFCDTRTASWWPAYVGIAAYGAVAVACSARNVSPLEAGAGTFWPIAPLYVAAFWYGLRIARHRVAGARHLLLGAVIAGSMVAGGAVTYLRAVQAEARWLMWLPYGIGFIGGCAALLYAVTPGVPGQGVRALLRVARLLARIGRASLGIYVLHPALVAPGLLVAHGRGGAWVALAVSAAAVGAGTVLVERLRSVPGLRRAI
jgi:fucose 4-O-acetylase-like acetyltransferase